jgi:Protein of unknown function (DUF4239)
MNAYLVGTLWLVGVSVAAVIAVLAMRRWGRNRNRPVVEIEVLSAVFSLAGMLFAIVAAFVFIDVWSGADEARDATYAEAEAAQLVAWSANEMPDADRAEMVRLSRAYLHRVIDNEWPQLDRSGGDYNGGWLMVQQMHEIEARNRQPTDSAPSAVESLLQARQERISLADSKIGQATWFALMVGAALAVVPMFFFPFQNAFAQLALTATVASLITLLLFTIQQIERPFSNNRVAATAYEQTLTRIPAL